MIVLGPASTINLEIFIVKCFCSRWQLRKLILRKLACTINATAVRGHSYENFYTKTYHTKVSLHENFQIYRGWVINRLPQNPFHTDAPLKTEQNATKQDRKSVV